MEWKWPLIYSFTHLSIQGVLTECLVGARQSTICLGGTVNKRDMVHLLVEIIVYWEKQRINEKTNVGGGHQEDMIESWPTSWFQAIGGSPPLPLSLECMFCPQWELILRTQLWGSNVLLNHLDGISDWNQLKPLCKLLGFWQVGAEIYSSCGAQDKPHM